jgi:hypothetical protein
MADPAPDFDVARLIADIRRGDEDQIAKAYRITFGNDLGRLVLAHFLVECGVGNHLGAPERATAMFYQAGRHDAALELAARAGLDQTSVSVGVMTDELQGTTDDVQFNHPADRGPAYLPGAHEEIV